MIHRPARVPDRQRRSPDNQRKQSLSTQIAALSDRLEATERRQHQLHNATAALAREVGVSIGCVCSHCDESYTLIRAGQMYCPRCGHQQSL